MILNEKQLHSLRKRLVDNSVPEPNTGCWLWEKAEQNFGYGLIGIGRKKIESTHRASYLCFVGHIPHGLLVRHKCDTPQCCNPEHLILGTVKDNSNDMVQRRRHYYHKNNKCKNGHEYTVENTLFVFNSRMKKDQRICKSCAKIRRDKFNSKKEKKAPYKKPFKKYCKYGHKYEGDNIKILNKGIRICRECDKRRIYEKKIKRQLGILAT